MATSTAQSTIGADAVELIGAHLDRTRAELDAWESVARATAYS